jgi:hypothetical protein
VLELLTLLGIQLAPHPGFAACHYGAEQDSGFPVLAAKLVENPGLMIRRRWIQSLQHFGQHCCRFAGALELLKALPQLLILTQQFQQQTQGEAQQSTRPTGNGGFAGPLP